MQNVIYIDSIFMVNVIMDLFLLMLTAKTLKKTATFLRLLAGGVIGATGYCLVLCLPDLSYFMKTAVGMIPAVFIMIKVGCQTRGVKEFLYAAGYLFTYAFLFGGLLLFLMKRIPFLKAHGDSIILILGIGFLGFWFCFAGIKRYREKRQNHFCKIRLRGDEGEISIYGLVDTGNGLIDPVSGKPVAILEAEVWQKMKKAKKPEKYKVIPFHSIGKESGILEGYEVEQIEIEYEIGRKELTHVLIAVFQGKLSVKGDYQMIVPPGWSF